MTKRYLVLVVTLMFSLLLSVSYATETRSHNLSIYLGEKVNLEHYIQKEQLNFKWTKDTIVQNLNASVLLVDSSSTVSTKAIGTGVLEITNGEDKLRILITIESPIEKVVLESRYLPLMLGEIYDLEYTVVTKSGYNLPQNDGIQWTSSKTKVATISNGTQIVTKAVGDTTITGKIVDGTVVATLDLTVLGHSENVRIVSSGRVRRLNVGETLNLSAFFGSKDITNNVKWESLTPHILKVDDNGVITAVGEGRGEVKAQSSINHKNATYELDAYSMIDRIELNNTLVKFKGVGQTHQLYFSLYPKDKSYPPILSGYKYTTSNENVATVSESGLITSKGPGIALISIIFDDSQKRAACTVEVSGDEVFNGTSYIAVESIELSSFVGTALIGQKIPMTYTVVPENASHQDVEFDLLYGDNGQIHLIDGQYYFIPDKRGNIKIEITADGKSDSVVIPVTSPIESLDLSLSTRWITGTNEEHLYLGEKAKLLTRIYARDGYDKQDVYPSSLEYSVKNENIAALVSEGGTYYVKGLRKGKTEITVANLEGLHETTLWVEVVDPIVSVSTDDEVTLPISMGYRPRISTNFISLSKSVSESFNIYDMMNLSVERFYIHEDFLKDEIKYEEDKIASYGNPPYDLSTRDAVDSHQGRMNQLKRYKSSAVDEYALLEDIYTLKDRSGRNYGFYSIDGGTISSDYPVKVLLSVGIDHTTHSAKTTLVFQSDETNFSIVRVGKTYGVATLLNQHGIGGILSIRPIQEQIELFVTYINHVELFKKVPTYNVLRSLADIDRSGLVLPSYEDLDEPVTKGDLAKVGVGLHQKYINRFLNFDTVAEVYYYDVVVPETKNAISLNYIDPNSEAFYGTGTVVALQDYYAMLSQILPSYEIPLYNGTMSITFETLIVEIGKLLR